VNIEPIRDLLTQLSEVLRSPAFCVAHRVNEQAFTRQRCLSLPTTMIFLLQLIGGRALQYELDAFFGALHEHTHAVRCVSKSALSQARSKFKASAFVALNQAWVQRWCETVATELWRGWRVLAADGTCLRLPRTARNAAQFGPGPNKDGSCVMARCVALYAVAARQWLEMVVGKYEDGERSLLLQALDAILPGDLLVLDRGYPAYWLFAALQARGVQFCARIEGCGWAGAQRLLRGSQYEYVMHAKLKAKDRRQLEELGLTPPKTLSLRLVKVVLPNGHLEILATSLMDQEGYPTQAFAELYHQRWGIEEGFKLVKHRQHLEGFSGEMPESIRQEIQAKILMHNIVQAVSSQAQQGVRAEQQGRYSVNRAYAIKAASGVMVTLLKGCKRALGAQLKSLLNVLSKTLERVRANRSFPRNHSIGGAQKPRRTYR
jgi:Transposase DDE domain